MKTAQDDPKAESRNEYNADSLQQRRSFYYSFVKQGSPCLKLKPEYDRILKQITLPKAVQEELKLKIDEHVDVQTPKSIERKPLKELLHERDNLADLLGDGKYHLIPTFYKTIINLKKQKKEFAIVFRPFGTDPKNVLREFNKFCQGDHPCFSGRNNTPIVRFEGSKGTKNYVITEAESGLFYRYDRDLTSTQLVMGTLRRCDKKKLLKDEYEQEMEDDTVRIRDTIPKIHLQILESLKESCGLCLQDDYKFYQQQGDAAFEDHAKLLFIDPTDYDTLHIFFDDNIHDSDRLNLVDVVDAITGEKIPRRKALNKYLVRVDIVDAIKDQDYFIKQIDQCDKLRSEEIERIEKGIPEDVPDVPKKTEFELLQEASDSDYLRKTILPLLQPALQLVDLERPSDPLTFIALYCLKNKDRVKIPQPTQEYLDSLNQPQEEVEAQQNTNFQQTEIKK